VTRQVRGEGSGADVAEARADAIEQIRKQAPGVADDQIELQVVEEGERGLLGIGARPARVVAFAEVPDGDVREESEIAAWLRSYLALVANALGTGSKVELEEAADGITARFDGGDLGILIGRRGQTIDAIQFLANTIARRREGEGAKQVTVDASGYRDRQKAALSYAALGAAKRALATGEPQALEPMSALERRLVHERLKGYEGVQTASEGTEPNRYVVVSPVDDRQA
jgi:spoIIIJ-associated protein